MGVLQSFNIGISGLQATGEGMSVIGDNIANAGTTGFKSSRAEFQDVLASSLKGIDGGDQIGAGTKLAHIKPNFTQGNISRTDNITDLAINGNGFFAIEASFGQGYSRDGSFHFNKEGFLCNSDGFKIKGFKADREGNVSNKIETIKLGNTTIPAEATQEVKVDLNLDSRVKMTVFDPKDPDKTSGFNSSVTVYDSVGTARVVTAYFNKVANSNWEYHIMADAADSMGAEGDLPVEMAKGKLVFDGKGYLQEEISEVNAFNFNNGAGAGQAIKFDFGESIKDGGTGLEASTQFGSDSAIARHTQDGASAATLTSLSFDDAGMLTAVYNNGTSRSISQIGVAKFENNEGLFKVGKNMFKESRLSGQGALGKPGEAGRGEILSKSIELSNVDIAQEFVNLMTAQRNFQANAKTITTADQMLQEVLNIKR